MSKIESLKRELGLITGADLPPRPKPRDDHGAERAKWRQAKRLAFRELAPAALCLVATDGPVSVVTYDVCGNVTARFGHNRGCWPARLARTGAWEDRISEAYDKNPFVRTGVQIRLWAATPAQRDKLVLPATDMLGALAEEALGAQLMNGFVDLGPDLQMEMLEIEMRSIADRARVAVWDDDELSAYLDQCVVEAERMRGAGV